MRIYKNAIIFTFCLTVFISVSCTLLKPKSEITAMKHYPINDLPFRLSTKKSTNPCEYIVFDRDIIYYTNSQATLYKSVGELIELERTETGFNIKISKKKKLVKVIKTIDIQVLDVYRVKSKKSNFIVIQYHISGVTGIAANSADFLVIDKQYNTYSISGSDSSLSCFSDLDNDGDIDFLEIKEVYDSQISFERHIPVYHFNFVEFDKGKLIKRNLKYSKLAVIDCNEGDFIQIHKDSISNLKVNPCLEENISIRREIEKFPSPIID